MQKTWLIARREFLIRFKNKKFWLMTLLGPILLAVFIVIVGFSMAESGDEELQLVILDESDLFGGRMNDEAIFYFTLSEEAFYVLRERAAEEYDGILYVPPMESLDYTEFTVNYYTNKNLNIEKLDNLKSILRREIRNHKLSMLNISQRQLDRLDTRVVVQSEAMDPEAADASSVKASEFSSYLGAAIGMLMGFVMYLLVFMNGSMVMRKIGRASCRVGVCGG